MHLISWDKVIFPKSSGGLAIKDMTIMKSALNCNRIMNLLNQLNNILASTHFAKYGNLDLWTTASGPHKK